LVEAGADKRWYSNVAINPINENTAITAKT
jgi:hypothetical protein